MYRSRLPLLTAVAAVIMASCATSATSLRAVGPSSSPAGSPLVTASPNLTSGPTPTATPSAGDWSQSYGPVSVELRIDPRDAAPGETVHFDMHITAPAGYRVLRTEWWPGGGNVGNGFDAQARFGPCPSNGAAPEPAIDKHISDQTPPDAPPGTYKPRLSVVTATCNSDGSMSAGAAGGVDGQFTIEGASPTPAT
jgi:hypothetical protein